MRKGKLKTRQTITALILLLLAAGILIIVRNFIGFVPLETEAGTVSQLDILMKFPAVLWHGFYGISLMVPEYTGQQSATVTGADVTSIHLLFRCLEPEIEHEIYASRTQYPQWSTISAASYADINTYLGVNSSEYTSAENTFTQNISIRLGARTINKIPGAYTKQAGVGNSTTYNLGILKDAIGNIIMVTKIAGFEEGFNELITNYQLMVPVAAGTTPRYYFFTDPYDDCPAGLSLGLTGGKGYIYGWITDNSTKKYLESVYVMAAGNSTISNQNGFYNFSVLTGEQILAAAKTGYNNYVARINVTLNDGIEHNISMEETAEFTSAQTGVGPGIGPGIGPGQDVGPGIGPGIGPGVSFKPDIGPYLEEPKRFEGMDIWVSTTQLDKVLRIGTYMEDMIKMYNFKEESIYVRYYVSGNVTPSIKIDKTATRIQPKAMGNLSLTFFGNQATGTYTGNLTVEAETNFTIPIRLRIVSEDMLPVEAVLIDVQPTNTRINPGDAIRYKVDLKNLLSDQEFEVYLRYSIKDIDNTRILHTDEDKVKLKTSYTILKSYQIPKNATLGEYIIQVDAYHGELVTTGTAIFDIVTPLYKYSVFGIMPLWQAILIILGLGLIFTAARFVKKEIERRKRFHVKVEQDLLPQQGPRSIHVGKIAETEKKTYLDMDNLTVHTIVAGSTGGGKTISAQVIIEECLMKGVAVVVFDPTAQWSGYLRKCTDKRLMSYYPKHGLKKTDARAFPGNIRYVENPYEIINLKKYMIPGNIQVFTLNKLDPKDIDLFVANTVREVFHLNLPEARELKLMLVYDEVHRLLPKFGGSGEGFIQIERACREFRKWGVGVMLISQVLADFVGQIKANINTEIQMKTRDEGDLARIETKFGKGLIQSLVKSPVGSGMVQNAAYNRGNPYFIEFRPILHSVERLTDEELQKYNSYNNDVDDLEYEIDQLEEHKLDVFDLRLELKLAKDKLQTGNFNMVDIYLEGLKPRMKSTFEKMGILPKKRKIKLVDRAALEEELKRAKQAREKYEGTAKKPEAEAKAKSYLKFDEDVTPDRILKLKNDMLVVSIKNLIDEVAALKQEHYRMHVNESKNDFAEWIENATGRKALAKKVRATTDKNQLVQLLEESYKKEKSGAKEEEEKEAASNEPKQEEKKTETPPTIDSYTQAMLLISQIAELINKQQIDTAKERYKELTSIYSGLSKEQKANLSEQCQGIVQQLHQAASNELNNILGKLSTVDQMIQEGKVGLALDNYKEAAECYSRLNEQGKKQVIAKCNETRERLKKLQVTA